MEVLDVFFKCFLLVLLIRYDISVPDLNMVWCTVGSWLFSIKEMRSTFGIAVS